eukprot:1156911-Pelagomonas_calceolata.AAC.6
MSDYHEAKHGALQAPLRPSTMESPRLSAYTGEYPSPTVVVVVVHSRNQSLMVMHTKPLVWPAAEHHRKIKPLCCALVRPSRETHENIGMHMRPSLEPCKLSICTLLCVHQGSAWQ